MAKKRVYTAEYVKNVLTRAGWEYASRIYVRDGYGISYHCVSGQVTVLTMYTVDRWVATTTAGFYKAQTSMKFDYYGIPVGVMLDAARSGSNRQMEIKIVNYSNMRTLESLG